MASCNTPESALVALPSPSQASTSEPEFGSATSLGGFPASVTPVARLLEEGTNDIELNLFEIKPASFRDVQWYGMTLRKIPLKRNPENGMRRIPAHVQSTGPMYPKVGRWNPYVHPKGRFKLYFRWKNFYTTEYLYSEETLKVIDATAEKLLDEISKHPELVLDDIEAGLCLMNDDENVHRPMVGGYYLADKVKEKIFWLEDVDEDYMNDSKEVSILDQDHMTHIAQYCYWKHVNRFPHSRKYSPKQVAKFQAELDYWMLDRGLSLQSNLPYSTEEIDLIIRILKDITEFQGTAEEMPTLYVVVLAELNSRLAYTQFVLYHEQYSGRVHDTGSSLWLKIIFWLLFTPSNYTERLRAFSMDNSNELVSASRWSTLLTDLREDWVNSMTPTTVILAANVGFLAIQSVDNEKGAANRSVGQIISYISLILSIGNIFACVILGGILHRSLMQSSPGALNFFFRHLGKKAGRKKLAIILSIPTAFFLWGLLTFLMSIIWMCFYRTGITTRLVVGLTILFSACLIGTAFHMGRVPQRVNRDLGALDDVVVNLSEVVWKKGHWHDAQGYYPRRRPEPTCRYKWWWRRRT